MVVAVVAVVLKEEVVAEVAAPGDAVLSVPPPCERGRVLAARLALARWRLASSRASAMPTKLDELELPPPLALAPAKAAAPAAVKLPPLAPPTKLLLLLLLLLPLPPASRDCDEWKLLLSALVPPRARVSNASLAIRTACDSMRVISLAR